MGDGKRWPREDALRVAHELIDMLSPWCDRMEIAGSLRRGKPDVGDIELLVIPKYIGTYDLFGIETGRDDVFQAQLNEIILPPGPLYLRRGKGGKPIGYGALNKYLVHTMTDIPVDIFTATPENWGRDLIVRTGSAEFNVAVMSRFKELHMSGHAYGPAAYTDRFSKPVTCSTERDMFEALGWGYIEPGQRTGTTQ